ncbi:MAG: iron ABC transporter permease [Marinovum sp.]|nr:iron ABC transporter permease [Marinovum sp.]
MPRSSFSLLNGLAWLVAGLCLLPFVAVATAAFTGSVESLMMLWDTVLWRYISSTLTLVVLVSLGTFTIGASTAWLVTMTEFKGRRALEIALVLPLAMPAYVMAYGYTHVFDHPGIVQTTLRSMMGWGPRDYWFPEIRSLGGAALMLTLVLYPYVYLLARTAFLSQSSTPFLAARALGRSPWQAFWSVSLPMARPAIAAGVLLTAMETIADYGTVSFFAVPTFATGIYNSWFGLADRGAAAQLSLGLLAFALFLAILERNTRGAARYDGAHKGTLPRMHLSGWRNTWATIACATPVALGVVLPVIALSIMAMESEQELTSRRYISFIQNSLTLASVAAVVTVTAALVLGSAHRFVKSRGTAASLYIARLGYAVPGGVIAVGLMVPGGAFDNALDAFMESRFGIDTGLLITGTITALVVAYMIRFLAAALGAYEGGLSGVSANIDAAGRVLGQGRWGVIRKVHVPVLTPSMLTALLIVFVDVMKELPATLIMRPFNYDTLAVQAHRLASDERLEGAAVPSLVLVAIGLVPVMILCRRLARQNKTAAKNVIGDEPATI